MKTLLTDRALKAMKPAAPGTRKMIWDAAIPSFGARVTDKGQVTFIVMRRIPGEKAPKRRKLGQYPIMALGEAREAALEALRDIEKGNDPKRKKEAERRAEAQRRSNSFASVAEDFIARHVRKLRTGLEVEAAARQAVERRRGSATENIVTEASLQRQLLNEGISRH